MKSLNKKFRSKNLRSAIIVYVLFCLMFPYSLFAETTSYRAPRNSISYFVEDQQNQQVSIVAPPEPAQEDAYDKAPAPSAVATKAPVQGSVEQTPIKEERFEMNWQSEQPVLAKPATEKKTQPKAARKSKFNVVRVEPKTPIIIEKKKVEMAPVTTQRTPDTIAQSSPFAKVLARMQIRKAQREAEAQKLGVVLPSQGGDISTVSPALSKINQTLKNIVNRHKCPSNGNCNFCR